MISLYIAQKSWLHRCPAGFKLFALILLSVLLYPVSHLWLMGFILMASLAVYASLGLQIFKQIHVLKPLIPLFFIIFLMQSWSVGIASASLLVMRMLILVLLANLVTLTTRMDDMMSAIEPLFLPLKLFSVEPKRIAFAVTLLIRFIPVLMAVIDHLMEAWRARGGRRKVWKLAIPLTIQSIRLSDHVAEALTARGGISANHTTKVHTHDSR